MTCGSENVFMTKVWKCRFVFMYILALGSNFTSVCMFKESQKFKAYLKILKLLLVINFDDTYST